MYGYSKYNDIGGKNACQHAASMAVCPTNRLYKDAKQRESPGSTLRINYQERQSLSPHLPILT